MPLLSAKDYAAHRGVTAQAVSKAIKTGRLKDSLVHEPGAKKPRIDSELADREWQKNSDPSKARGEAGAFPSAESGNTPTRAFGLPYGENSPPAGEAIDYQKERGKREHFLAKIAEIELAEKMGELVPASQVEQQWLAAAALVRSKVMGIHSKAKQRIPELTPAQIGILEELQREALEEIANAGAGESVEVASGQAG